MITVLIVDDEPLVRSSIRIMLQEMNLITSVIGEADNGEDALLCYKKFLPNLCLRIHPCMPESYWDEIYVSLDTALISQVFPGRFSLKSFKGHPTCSTALP